MQESGGYRLIVRRGPQPNQTFELNKDVVTLGRDITNDIVINDPEVSRHHLRLTQGAEGYSLEDLGSTNGTFIGGQRVSGVRPLNRGDTISLGETVTLVYEVVRPGVGPEPTSPAAGAQPGGEAQSQQPQQPQQAQQSPPQPDYGRQEASPQPDYGEGAQGGYYSPSEQAQQAPPPPPQPDYGAQPAGYEADYGYGAAGGYDPYAVREEGQPSTWRWVVIGCASLGLFCCCATTVGLVVVDAADLWCDIPVFSDIVTPIFGLLGEALGIIEEAKTC